MAVSIVHGILAIDGESASDSLCRAGEWARALSSAGLDASRLGPEARAVLGRAAVADGGRFTEALFAQALGAVLLERRPGDWDDRSLRLFEARLRRAASEAEQAALGCAEPGAALAPLIRRRISDLYAKLEATDGAAAARAFARGLQDGGGGAGARRQGKGDGAWRR